MAGTSPTAPGAALDAYFRSAVTKLTQRPQPQLQLSQQQLELIFDAQAGSRHLDVVARELQSVGEGFYTIGSAGHESNAAIAYALRTDDPALLHYRSGGFYLMRSGPAGVRDVLQGLMGLSEEPIAGGRHKVFGNKALSIIPQTSTIASHLPRAVGLAIALPRAYRVAPADANPQWPSDAIVVASFGDASANHSTATGAINTAINSGYRGLPVPVLFVCEDNGYGISVPTPKGWIETAYGSRPGLEYFCCDGTDPDQVYATARAAAEFVRRRRRPAFLHLHCVRFLAHAGSDAEISYRTQRQIEADFARDPLLGTAQALVDQGLDAADVLARYADRRADIDHEVQTLIGRARLGSAEEVMGPLAPRHPDEVATRALSLSPRALSLSKRAEPGPSTSSWITMGLEIGATLAESINKTLDEILSVDRRVIIFGEDVGVKGGVYGVTRGLARKHGAARVFDSILDEQSILGLALGAGLSGLLPIPEVQYLAYLHNAIDQLRGEAATQQFFSSGQYRNPMVLRLPGLSYQKGFGGHFHNDNAVAALRDIPGLVVGCPSQGDDAAGMLRTLVAAGAVDGTVSVFLEPIALYHRRDLHEDGDNGWLSVDHGEQIPIGSGRIRRTGSDLTMITFGNGVPMSLQVAERLASSGIDSTVLDLRWLNPLPVDDILTAAAATEHVLVVDETRHSGGVGESVLAALAENGFEGSLGRVASQDSIIPLGRASDHVLLGPDEIEKAAHEMISTSRAAARRAR